MWRSIGESKKEQDNPFKLQSRIIRIHSKSFSFLMSSVLITDLFE